MQITKTNYSQNMNFVHQNFKVNENFYSATKANLSYFNTALSNSAEPGNSNDKHMADKCTPLNACFFMRSTNTPKESVMQICTTVFLSMVACYGKGFALCCVPYVAVFQPVTRYRQSLETFAVTSKNFTYGVTAMLYLFKAVSRSDLRNTRKLISSFPRYTVRITADSIKQATAQVAPFFVILEAREANSHLIKKFVSGSIASTITINGSRTRKTCGFFTPQIHLTEQFSPSENAEFVARSIRRTKAEFIRTNKASRFIAVVEALPHLKQVGTSFTNTIKRLPTMKTFQKTTALMAGIFPIAFTSAMAEVRNA